MATAILLGAGSGALHAVTGPDHLLSLGPVVLERPRKAAGVGLVWGVGHGIGTLLLAAAVLLMAEYVNLSALDGWSGRIAGAVLIATGLVVLHKKTDPQNSAGSPTLDSGSSHAGAPLTVGLLHGATGASALLLLLPAATQAVQAGNGALPAESGAYLIAFAVGSTLAMGALTGALGALSTRAPTALRSGRVQRALGSLSVAFGAAWVAFGG